MFRQMSETSKAKEDARNTLEETRVVLPAFGSQREDSQTVDSTLSKEEQKELLELLNELFNGYSDYIEKITLSQVILKDGTVFDWRPPKEKRTEEEVLNNPSLIEQCLPIYIPGKDWKTHSDHDWHAGRFRESHFFKALFGQSEMEAKKKLTPIKWMEKTFKEKSVFVTTALNVSEVFQKLSTALEKLPNDVQHTFLEEIGGTFCWRVIAGTKRLSSHSFGMTLDLDASQCEYWLWDYRAAHKIGDSVILKEEDILACDLPEWRNRVPFEIVELFEQYGFIWGGKWRKYDTMHFEYRPEFFVRSEVKQRIRQLLGKEGYELLPPLAYQQSNKTSGNFQDSCRL